MIGIIDCQFFMLLITSFQPVTELFYQQVMYLIHFIDRRRRMNTLISLCEHYIEIIYIPFLLVPYLNIAYPANNNQ